MLLPLDIITLASVPGSLSGGFKIYIKANKEEAKIADNLTRGNLNSEQYASYTFSSTC